MCHAGEFLGKVAVAADDAAAVAEDANDAAMLPVGHLVPIGPLQDARRSFAVLLFVAAFLISLRNSATFLFPSRQALVSFHHCSCGTLLKELFLNLDMRRDTHLSETTSRLIDTGRICGLHELPAVIVTMSECSLRCPPFLASVKMHKANCDSSAASTARAWSDMRDKRSAARKSKDLSALLGGSGFTTGNFGVVEYYAKCIFCQIRKTYLCIKNE